MNKKQVNKKDIVLNVDQLRMKMKGSRNRVLYTPKKIQFFLEEEDIWQMKVKNIRIEELED